jgi:hypothetical protein
VSLFFDCHDSFYQESFPVFLVPVGVDEDDVVVVFLVYFFSVGVVAFKILCESEEKTVVSTNVI